jgi:hypothetical protein
VAIAGAIIQQRTDDFEPEHVPRQLSGDAAAADRGQIARACDQAANGFDTAAGNCFDGRFEAKPRGGSTNPETDC